MPCICNLFVGYAESALLIESAMKRYTEWQVQAGFHEEERAQLVSARRTNE